MTNENKKTKGDRLSVGINPSIKESLIAISEEQNLNFSDLVRGFIYKGLESHGVTIRGNQVIE